MRSYGDFISMQHRSDGECDMMINTRFFRRIQSNCFNHHDRLAECDAQGVHVNVLSTVPVMFNYNIRPEHGLEVARFLNDDLAGTVAKAPSRLVALGTVPLQAPDLAARVSLVVLRQAGCFVILTRARAFGWRRSCAAA
jgi:aminocarboxymuconate-semialdehyde decarboxylase